MDFPVPSGFLLSSTARPDGAPGSAERARPDRLPTGRPELAAAPPRGNEEVRALPPPLLTWAPREGAQLRCLLGAGSDPLQQHRGFRGRTGARCAGGCGGVAERRGGELRERCGDWPRPGRSGAGAGGRAGGGTEPSGRAAAGPRFTARLFSITKAKEMGGVGGSQTRTVPQRPTRGRGRLGSSCGGRPRVHKRFQGRREAPDGCTGWGSGESPSKGDSPRTQTPSDLPCA